jgi:membrane-associated phospholipid phosphatase
VTATSVSPPVPADPTARPARRPSALLRSRPVAAALLAGATTLAVLALLGHHVLLTIDEPLARIVRDQGWLEVLRPINELGSERQGAALAVVAGLVMWRWCRRLAWAVPAIVLGTVGLNVLMKLVIDRPRPPEPLGATALASFPSGHVLHAVVLLGLVPPIVHLVTGRRWAFWSTAGIVTLLAVCVAALRVYLGAHWPSDVLGSLLIGGLVLAAVEGLLMGRTSCAARPCALHGEAAGAV